MTDGAPTRSKVTRRPEPGAVRASRFAGTPAGLEPAAGSAPGGADRLVLEDLAGLDRVVGREGDLEVAPDHPDRQGGLDVEARLGEVPGDLGEGPGLVRERRGDELDLVELPLTLAHRASRGDFIIGEEGDGAGVPGTSSRQSR